MNSLSQQPIAASSQQCSVRTLYRPWLAYAAGLIAFTALGNWVGLAVCTAAVPLGKWVEIRAFRHLSPLFGYGRVDDRLPSSVQKTSAAVTLYQAMGCPFCPMVLERLRALQPGMGFKLDVVDVTLHPKTLERFGVRSVPVVESSGRLLLGNATSEQLAELIAPSAALQAAR